jgi:hypothetical protein
MERRHLRIRRVKLTNIIRAFARAGYDRLICPIPGCSAYGELPLRSWLNHLFRAHLKPESMRPCPHARCPVTGRDPGMRVHIRSHEGS